MQARPPASTSPPRRRRGGKLKWLVVAVGLGALGILAASGSLGKQVKAFFATKDTSVIRYNVTKASIPVTVVERGQLESSRNLDVQSEVEGTPQIIDIKPEGTQVKKGELVCELDSASSRTP